MVYCFIILWEDKAENVVVEYNVIDNGVLLRGALCAVCLGFASEGGGGAGSGAGCFRNKANADWKRRVFGRDICRGSRGIRRILCQSVW